MNAWIQVSCKCGLDCDLLRGLSPQSVLDTKCFHSIYTSRKVTCPSFPADIVRGRGKVKDSLDLGGKDSTMRILFDINSAFIHPIETWS